MGCTCQVSIRLASQWGCLLTVPPGPKSNQRPAAWLPRDWLLALKMRVISAMTFLFRLDVYACGGGRNESFSHSVCLCLPVCVHIHKLDSVNVQTITIPPSVAFVLVFDITLLDSDLSTCYRLFSEIIRFPLN